MHINRSAKEEKRIQLIVHTIQLVEADVHGCLRTLPVSAGHSVSEKHILVNRNRVIHEVSCLNRCRLEELLKLCCLTREPPVLCSP